MMRMIRIEPLDFKSRTCNSCNRGHNVKLVVIRYDGTNSRTQIALCRKCREVLRMELELIDAR